MSALALDVPLRETAPRPLPPLAAPPTPYSREHRTLGDPTPLACTVAKTALEAALGGGGVDRLTRWVSPEIRESLARQAALAERAGREPAHPVRILRIRVFRASEVSAETSIVADDGDHVRAIAARFEDVGGRWRATALEIG